jgi:hypothetical protein
MTEKMLNIMLNRLEAAAAERARLTDRIALLRADRELFSRWNAANDKSTAARGA